jgi:GrpB-like predicted nucleotidyltransferase (UPF0157 family)
VSVQVKPYSESWPALFAEAAQRLRRALAPWLSGDIQHIGSTAVPGLAAKPILDMLAPVQDIHAARAAIPILADLGYRHAEHRPQEAVWFYRQQGDDYGTRTHQLHLTQADSALWRERLTFRDALRDDQALRVAYQELKHGLASEVGVLTGYTAGKRDFVRQVLLSKGLDIG